jgi:DNA-binding beta-propeller fold protein YncE
MNMKYRTILPLIALGALMLAPLAHAMESDVTPFYSITEDEEGEKVFSPAFVLAEPVMKEIYVISRTRVLIYTEDFYPLYTFGKDRGIESPLSVAVDAEGYVFVAQSPTEGKPEHRISVYNPRFLWERDIIVKGFEGDDSFKTDNITIDRKGRIYVTGLSFPGVPVIDREGKLLEFLQPVEDGGKVAISDVAVDGSGRIYLLSTDNSHVYVYNEEREFLFQFGQKGGSTGKLSRPVGLDVDETTGRIYVVDFMRHAVVAYDSNGKWLFEFAGMGWGPGWLQYPSDIAVDSSGRVIVADTFNNKVEVYKPAKRREEVEGK